MTLQEQIAWGKRGHQYRAAYNARNLDILILRESGALYKDIAQHFGISKARAQQICYKEWRVRAYKAGMPSSYQDARAALRVPIGQGLTERSKTVPS